MNWPARSETPHQRWGVLGLDWQGAVNGRYRGKARRCRKANADQAAFLRRRRVARVPIPASIRAAEAGRGTAAMLTLPTSNPS